MLSYNRTSIKQSLKINSSASMHVAMTVHAGANTNTNTNNNYKTHLLCFNAAMAVHARANTNTNTNANYKTHLLCFNAEMAIQAQANRTQVQVFQENSLHASQMVDDQQNVDPVFVSAYGLRISTSLGFDPPSF